MNAKKQVEIEKERKRIAQESIFGIWTDELKTTEFKIVPSPRGVRVKFLRVEVLDIVSRISVYCGADADLKRRNWKGFEFIDGLTKVDYNLLDYGTVHMPKARRKVYASLSFKKTTCVISFYSDKSTGEVRNFGLLHLTKSAPSITPK